MVESPYRHDKLTRLAVAADKTHNFRYHVAVTSPDTSQIILMKRKREGY